MAEAGGEKPPLVEEKQQVEEGEKTAEQLEIERNALQIEVENEMDNTTLISAQMQQHRMIEKTQQAIELRKFKQQIEEYEEMCEDIIDTLYDYEEKLEQHGVFLEKSAAEAFEDAKCEVTERAKRENIEAAPMPANLQKLIQIIKEGGAANLKLSKASEIAIAKQKRLQDKHTQLTELLEEVQSTISASAEADPREIIRKNRVLKKQIEELKQLLEETLTGLNSKSDTNLKSLKAKSLKLKKQKNQLVRDIKKANDAAQSASAKDDEKKEDMEAKLAILREFKAASEAEKSSAKLKVLQQKARNDLLAIQVRTTKQHNTATKAHLKEEAELASGNPEEVALKRRIQALRKQLVVAKKIVSGGDDDEDLEGDGPADPAKFAQLEKKVALKEKERKMAEEKLASTRKQFEAASGAGGAKTDELMALKEELPKLKDDLAKAKQAIPDRKKEVEQLIKKMASGGGTLGVAAKKLRRAVRDLKGSVKGLRQEAGQEVKAFGPWVQENLGKVNGLAAERKSIAKKARENYKKEHKQRKQLYKELIAKQEELGEPIEPEADSDSD